MELPEVVEFARNFAVMVRVQGPDPKGVKMHGHAFYQYVSGKTTLSASGILLSDELFNVANWVCCTGSKSPCSSSAFVLTTASLLEPFLPVQHRCNPVESFSGLIPGARVDVLTEFGIKEGATYARSRSLEDPKWLQAEVLVFIDIHPAATAILSLMEAHGRPCAWEIGWNLDPINHASTQSAMDGFERQVANEIESCNGVTMDQSRSLEVLAQYSARMAVLGLSSLNSKELPHIDVSLPRRRGDTITVMGSPFGILSPLHFLNSVSTGAVANCHPHSSANSILMADIRCLPGMEGGPVLDKHASLIGLLIKPVKQKRSGAEIQLAITWNAIEDSWKIQLQNLQIARMNVNDHLQSSRLDKVSPSIVLVDMHDGAWGSGVVLNQDGLILTNAHLFEPWRFHGTVNNADPGIFPSPLVFSENMYGHESKNRSLPAAFSCRSYDKRIHVRLDHEDVSTWCGAMLVYISKGPLDVALLQLDNVPEHLQPIEPDFRIPLVGSNVHVIGHGLLGPRANVQPSICSGIVANVVEARCPIDACESNSSLEYFPAMLETSATVYPGASGGAVVNSEGHMVGLVTSNARHARGTLLPHLNFSIPCSALKPVFCFSEKQDNSILIGMDKPNRSLSEIWALHSSIPFPEGNAVPKWPISLLGKNKGERGFRFANYLAKQQHDLSDPVREKVSISTLCSRM